MKYPAHIEQTMQESNGLANPFMLNRDPAQILAYHTFEGKSLNECVAEFNRLNDTLKQIAGQATADDGTLDLEQVTLFAGTPQEKGDRIIEINSRLAGVMNALAPKRRKAQIEEMARSSIFDPGEDESGVPRQARIVRPSDFAVMQLREQGLELCSDEFKRQASTMGNSIGWEMEFPKSMSASRFLAAVFTTGSWDPDIPDEPGFVPMRQEMIPSISMVIPTFMTGRDAVDWMEETENVPMARETAEGMLVPESTYALARRSGQVERIAHYLPITEEALADEPEVRSYLDIMMPQGVRQKLDYQIVNGTGAANQLLGMTSNRAGSGDTTERRIQRRAVVRTGSNTGAIAGNPWNLLLDAAYDIADHGFGIYGLQMPTHALLLPNVFQECLKSTSSAGGYYVGGPQMPVMKTAWGMQVVESGHFKLTANTESGGNLVVTGGAPYYSGIIGDFSPMFIRLWMRHEVRTEVGMMNEDFGRFQLTMRSSVRCVFAITRHNAFVGLLNPQANGTAVSTTI